MTAANDQDDPRHMTVQQLLDAVAARTPTPGGGAVAPIVAALGAALAQMVLNFSIGKRTLAPHESTNRQALQSLQKSGAALADLAVKDARAYAQLNELLKLEATDPRRQSMGEAVRAAISTPRTVVVESLTLLELLQGLAGTTNRMLRSDLAIAAVLAEAAARAAAWSVRINLPLLDDAAERRAIEDELAQHLRLASELTGRIEGACRGEE